MSAHHAEPFPKSALWCAGVLLTLSIIAAGAGRIQHLTSKPVDPLRGARVTKSAELGFADARDGSVVVRDAGTGRLLQVLKPGQGGFVRGVMRGLARERRSLGQGPAQPFRLILADQGALWLRDEATGRMIDLNSFGSENRGAFLSLLSSDRVRS